MTKERPEEIALRLNFKRGNVYCRECGKQLTYDSKNEIYVFQCTCYEGRKGSRYTIR